MAATHATRTLQKAHNCLTRVVRHAESQDLVRRNVSALVHTPQGQEGRQSESLTLEQARALLEAAEKSRLHAFIVLCLLTGVCSEEARALTWSHADLDAGTIMVWRSVRAHGDTKTVRSRRTLKLPEIAVDALRARKRRQAYELPGSAGRGDRTAGGACWLSDYRGHLWRELRPVITTGPRSWTRFPPEAGPWARRERRRMIIEEMRCSGLLGVATHCFQQT